MPSVTGLELIKEALMEINAHAPGESLPSERASFALSKLNEILDAWNADGLMPYTVEFNEYTLTPNLQPHTLGPTGATFTVTQRPVYIASAALILTTSTPNVHCPLRIRDKDWWGSLSVPALASSIPSDLYYSPTFPNGSIYLWPKPNTAYGLKIETWTLLAQIANLATVINLPPAYKAGLVPTLAMRISPSLGKTPNALTIAAQMKAMRDIQGLNSKSPRMGTRDYGIPGGKGGYDIQTGGIR
jgi:hypothetical protein